MYVQLLLVVHGREGGAGLCLLKANEKLQALCDRYHVYILYIYILNVRNRDVSHLCLWY